MFGASHGLLECQVLFFSATFPEDVRRFGTGLIPTTKGIKVGHIS